MFEPSVNAISLFVKEQFPEFYETDGPNFIIFMQKYFEWMESSGQPTWFMRNALNFMDIDKTIDDYIIHFKKKYLKDIQFETFSNKILFIKNALDFYRSKGNIQAIDLFFQLIYGEQADVYLPKTDILRVSDGTWTKPIYIEVSDSSINNSFINKQIQGVRSGATAFVERFIKKKIGPKTINVFFISNLVGNFETDELLMTSTDGLSSLAPIMIGSLTTLEIVEGGIDFNVGDEVNLINNNGQIDGLALVTATEDITGVVKFSLLDGGFGYNNTTSIAIISDKVLGLSNVQITSNTISNPFLYFEQLIQPLANIQFNNLSGGSYIVGQNVYAYFANGTQCGVATILEVNQNTANGIGNAVVAQISGNIDIGNTQLHLIGNTGVTSNLTIFVDETVTSNVMGISTNATLYVTNSFGAPWSNGVNVTQGSTTAFINKAVQTGANTILVVSNVSGGVFYTNNQISSPTSNGTMYSMDISIGVITVINTFTNFPFNYVYGANSLTTATVNTVSTGAGAQFHIGLIDNIESFSIAVDLINGLNVVGVPFLDIQLDGANSGMGINAYGFTRLPQANLSSFLIQVFGGESVSDNIGTIETLTGINPGAAYNVNPFTLVYDPLVAQKGLLDYIIDINDLSSNFRVGEIIEQDISIANSASLVVNNATATIEYFSVSNGGIGYTNGDHVIAFSSGTNAIANVTTYANGAIKYLIVTNYGAGFVPSSTPSVSYTNSTGGTTLGSGANVIAQSATWLLGDFVYESNGSANIATGVIQFISVSNGSGLIQVNAVSGAFTNSFNLVGFGSNTIANIVTANLLPYSVTARGSIKSTANNPIDGDTLLFVRRLSYGSSFVSNTIILGLTTGSTANVVTVTSDPSSNVIGWDATVQANVIAADGSVSGLQVLDSGFGYSNGDVVTFKSLDGTKSGLADAIVSQQGQGAGFYTSSRGFLDDDKIVQDDRYWQEFSYEIRTNVPLNTYADIFKKVLHVAGTALFGAVFLTSNTDIRIKTATPNEEVYILTLGPL